MPCPTLLLAAALAAMSVAAPPSRTERAAPQKRPAESGGVAGSFCSCTGDLDHDGAVSGADLAILLGSWTNGGIADLDHSGSVNGADLAILLGAWGPCPSAPENDRCADATVIGEGLSHPICTYGADTDGPPLTNPDCTVFGQNQIDHDVWYEFIPPDDGTMEVSTCEIGWDTRIAVYGSLIPGLSACPTSGISFASFLGCNDDVASCGLASDIAVEVSKNQHYKVRIGGFAGSQGDGTFALVFRPVGSDCDHAIPINNPVSATIAGTNLDKDIGIDLPNCVTGEACNTWYSFTAPCTHAGATMTVSLCQPGTDFDTVVSIWRISPNGDCPGTLVACNDDSQQPGCQIAGLNRKSRVSFTTDPGWTYFIQVSGYLGAQGHYEMKVTLDSCP